jgi:hypothetical protein
MPVSYRIDRERGLIRTACIGPVTREEVLAHFEDLERESDLPERLDVLLDLRRITAIPDGEDIGVVAVAVSRLRKRVTWGACAVIAGEDASFGMSRVFEVRTGELFERVAVFRDMASAAVWLVVPPEEWP